jgi:copper chaperone CopZ
MTFSARCVLRGLIFLPLLEAAEPARAEYLRIQVRVYGLDCEVCARGVSASMRRLAGVDEVKVSLKSGMLDITLARGNNLKLSDLRKRVRANGFRTMEATVTAVGKFNGSRFDVLGVGESFDLGSRALPSAAPYSIEVTFNVP